MSDSAWLATKTKTETQKSEPTTEANSVENLHKLSTICWSHPDPVTVFNVMVKRRNAEVKVSTLSAEQKRELVEAKDKELNTFVKYSVVEAASRQGISPSALMKNALGCDVQG